MASIRNFNRSFSGGEVSPELLGRIDDAKYQAGLAICRNFICTPLGPVGNRAGLGFAGKVKDNQYSRLLPFVFSQDQALVIEMGAGYFRFYSLGRPVLNPNESVYEVANVYAQGDLRTIHCVQSNDVITLTHPNYPPYELRRYGALDWRFVKAAFGSPIAPPTGLALKAVGSGIAQQTYWYAVTAVIDERTSESSPCGPVSIMTDLNAPSTYVEVSWDVVPGASSYRIYRQVAGVYGLVGQTEGGSIIDEGALPDTSITPPIYEDTFAQAGDYPSVVSYFEQRKCFAGTLSRPNTIWMTRSATESDMSYSVPSRDDDRLKFTLNARELNAIRHIVPLNKLVILTGAAEWVVGAEQSAALTASSLHARPQSYIGASAVAPVVVNNALLYCANRSGHVREMGYSYQANGFVTGDVSLRAAHLFDGFEIVDMAYAKAPYPIVWCVNDQGSLLGLTYIPEQQIGAWHRHDTDGAFEACAVIPEGNEDSLYVVVRREVNGQTVRYVERLQSRRFDVLEDAFFVDSGKSYGMEPGPHARATTFSGLEHLEGKTVNILGDGAVFPPQVVKDGMVTIDHPVFKAHVGLPIVAEIKTLPLAAGIDNSFAQGRPKNVNKAWLRVEQSSGIFVGPSAERLTEFKQRTTEPLGTAPALKSEEIQIAISPSWTDGGQIIVRQLSPLPLTIVSLTTEVEIGG